MVELSLVIPCYNEEKNIGKVASGFLKELDGSGIGYELILVDNGSTDRTREVAAGIAGRTKRVKLVTVPVNKGYGHGILEGMKAAKGDFIGFSDGDGQVAADAITRLFSRMRGDKCHVGKTIRTKRRDGPVRRFASYCYDKLVLLIFFVDLSDINSKPKLMSREFYEKAGLNSQDWFIDTELLLKADAGGYGICTVPTEFKRRRKGSSHVRPGVVLEFIKNIIKYKLGEI